MGSAFGTAVLRGLAIATLVIWSASSVAAPASTTPPPSLRISPIRLDFGPLLVGEAAPTATVTVTNVTDAPVTLAGSGGVVAAPFTFSGDCADRRLAPGRSCHLRYGFTPIALGGVVTQATGTWNGQSFDVELSGTGVAPTFRVSARALEFGPVVPGHAAPLQRVTITNLSLAPVTMSGSAGGVDVPFTRSDDCGQTVLAFRQSCHLFFGFQPAQDGDASATSTETWNGSRIDVGLHGTGADQLPPATSFRITPSAIDFRDVVAGSSAPLETVKVTNITGSPVLMTGSADNLSPPFTATDDCAGATLAPGASCAMRYGFQPIKNFHSHQNVTARGSWAGQPFAIVLHGLGVLPAFRAIARVLDFGPVGVGQAAPVQTVTLTNVNPVPLLMHLSGGGGFPPFSASNDCDGTTLGPGRSCHQFFGFTPTSGRRWSQRTGGNWNGTDVFIKLYGIGV